jgi:NTE family protein
MLMPVTPKMRPQEKPPRLAVVLGSGGVRSIAGLGMLEVLFEQGIRPDLIVGCSAGAVFGAFIAAGHPIHESLKTATSLWSGELTSQKRWESFGQMVLPRWFRFGQDFSLRKDKLIMERLHKVFGHTDVADLPIAMRVCATDAESGQAVTLDRGDLVQALRASIALPFLFSPVKLNNRWLVDGVVSDPIPVNAAADASMVIAMGFESAMPRHVNSISRLVMQTSTAAINNLQQARMASAKASGQPMVFILPELERRVGLFQTSAMPYLFEAGRRATLDALPQIQSMWEAEKTCINLF